jgi:hypothetical protein
MKHINKLFHAALVFSAVLAFLASPSFAQHDHGGQRQPQAPMMPPREKMDMSEMMEKMSHIIEQNAEINKQMGEMMKAGVMTNSKGMINMYAMMQSKQALAKDMQTMMERLHEAMQDQAMMQDGKMKELMQGMQKHIKEMQKHTEGLTHSMEGVNKQLEKKMPKADEAEARPQSLQKVYVESAMAATTAAAGEELVIKVTGNLPSPAYKLERVEVQMKGKIVELIPLASVDRRKMAAQGLAPFEQPVKIKLPNAGEYLIRVVGRTENRESTITVK